jgi:hypothetical protein
MPSDCHSRHRSHTCHGYHWYINRPLRHTPILPLPLFERKKKKIQRRRPLGLVVEDIVLWYVTGVTAVKRVTGLRCVWCDA